MTIPTQARLGLALLTALALPAARTSASGPTYAALNFPGAVSTQALGINDQNQVVGTYYDDAGNLHSFVEANGTYYTADLPGAGITVATGISSDEVVGYYAVNSTDPYGNPMALYHGFALTRSGYTTLDVPGADPGTTMVNGVDSKDEIIGTSTTTTPGPYGPQSAYNVFLLKNGSYKALRGEDAVNGAFYLIGGLNTKGQIVGTYVDQNEDEQGLLLDGGKYSFIYGPAGSFLAYANGVNEAGQVVGYSESSSYSESSGYTNAYHGFLYSRGAYTSIAYPGAGADTFPNGINSNGLIVGSYSDAAGVSHGFLYTPNH